MEINKEINKVINSFKGTKPISYIKLINTLNEFDDNMDMSFQYWNRHNIKVSINYKEYANIERIIQYPLNDKKRDTAFRIVLKNNTVLDYWSRDIYDFRILK
jgi:hypothetical protein